VKRCFVAVRPRADAGCGIKCHAPSAVVLAFSSVLLRRSSLMVASQGANRRERLLIRRAMGNVLASQRNAVPTQNNRLERTVKGQWRRAASAPFHYALASRGGVHCAAAQSGR
jgi:hypothetical protein